MFDLNKFENNTAVITDCGEQLTYAELASVANEFAAAVPQKGLLFCLCENHIGSLVGYVACMEHHIPIVLLDGSKDISVLQNLMTIYQPEYIWISTDKIESIGGETIFKYATFSLQKMQYKVEIEKPEINPELALCLTTSLAISNEPSGISDSANVDFPPGAAHKSIKTVAPLKKLNFLFNWINLNAALER